MVVPESVFTGEGRHRPAGNGRHKGGRAAARVRGWIFGQEDRMAYRLEDKQALVTEVQAVARVAHSVVAAEYRGLTVSQMTGLRAKARESGVYVRVVKNTLARRAVAGTPYECIAGSLKGPLVLAFSK